MFLFSLNNWFFSIRNRILTSRIKATPYVWNPCLRWGLEEGGDRFHLLRRIGHPVEGRVPANTRPWPLPSKPPPSWCHPTILLGAIQPFYSIQPLWTLENPHLVPLLRLQISVRSSPSSCLVHQNNGEIHSAQQQQHRPERIDETFLQSTSASWVHPCIRPWCIISLSTREVVAGPRWDAFLVCWNSPEMHYASQALLC